MTEIVYHVTTLDRAEKCLVEGIVPYKTTMCQEATLERERQYDAVRPEQVARLGLSRLNTVYAHPDLDVAASRQNGGWLNRVRGSMAILGIGIADPSQVYVGDGWLNVPPFTAPEYWASITTLQHYREQQRPVFRAPNWAEHYNEHRPEKWREYLYMWPEVLIPGGVDANAVSLVSIFEKPLDEDADLAAM